MYRTWGGKLCVSTKVKCIYYLAPYGNDILAVALYVPVSPYPRIPVSPYPRIPVSPSSTIYTQQRNEQRMG